MGRLELLALILLLVTGCKETTIDDRVLTYLSLGSTLYGHIGIARPYVRLALVHQHEEPTSAYRDDPFGAMFGVGDGIRHRGGFGSSTRTVRPASSSASTTCVPMNPDPPVTATVLFND